MTNASLTLFFSGLSDIGYVREKNEDAWKILPEHRFFVLADGMGGLQCGEIASSKCVEDLCAFVTQIDQEIKETSNPIHQAIILLGAAIEKVNSAIFQSCEKRQNGRSMGTTLCALYFLNDTVIYAHVGDSRIYRFRPHEEKIQKLMQLTEDHSLVNDLIVQGDLTREEAVFSSYKNILTRAIGTNPHVEPAISWSRLKPDDLYLICSDGLTNYVTDKEIEKVLKKIYLNSSAHMEKVLEGKINELISLAKSYGGGDNITVILVLVQCNDLS